MFASFNLQSVATAHFAQMFDLYLTVKILESIFQTNLEHGRLK